MEPDEKWADVYGYEGAYRVSSIGRVMSLARKRSDGRSVPSRILKLSRHRDGHLRAALCRDGAAKLFFVHRIVLESFVSPCPPGMQGCHNNGHPGDNRVENLRWDTCKSNQVDKVNHGRSTIGTKNGNCKYSEDSIKRVKELRIAGLKYKEIERQTGVPWMYAWNIVQGKNWKHVSAR